MQSKRELSYAQRKLLAEMQSLYTEAETAQNEQAGLERAASTRRRSLRLTTCVTRTAKERSWRWWTRKRRSRRPAPPITMEPRAITWLSPVFKPSQDTSRAMMLRPHIRDSYRGNTARLILILTVVAAGSGCARKSGRSGTCRFSSGASRQARRDFRSRLDRSHRVSGRPSSDHTEDHFDC